MKRIIALLVPPLAVLILGFAVAAFFVLTAPKTGKAPGETEVTLVEVVDAVAVDRTVDVYGQGTVIAARVVVLKSEVTGRVKWVNPNLVPGGQIKKGDMLFRIDDRDYRLGVEQQAANVQRARFELAQERGRGRVAEREWKVMGDSAPSTPDGKALALRLPQLKSAKAALASAESGLAMAKLNVERTRVRAPFDAFVQTEEIEVAQLVDRQTVLGTLVGTEAFWVQVSLPVSDLRWIERPDDQGQGGSEVTLRQKLTSGEDLLRTGRVLRLAGDLDPQGRMARLIVSVENPMDGQQGQPPLLLGAYVQVEVHGKTLQNIVALPRRAVRTNDEVWGGRFKRVPRVQEGERLVPRTGRGVHQRRGRAR